MFTIPRLCDRHFQIDQHGEQKAWHTPCGVCNPPGEKDTKETKKIEYNHNFVSDIEEKTY